MDGQEQDAYSTADLEALLEEIDGFLREANIPLSPVHYGGARPLDLIFSHPEARLGEVLELIRACRPRIVFMEAQIFDAAAFLDDEATGLDQMHPARQEGQRRDGHICGVTVSWVLDGLLCTWLANAAWYDDLSDEADIAVSHARGLDDIDRTLSQQNDREQHSRCLALILADPDFRRAGVNKRTAAAKALLTSHGEEFEDAWLERELLKTVRQQASVEVAEQEQRLRRRLDELSANLIASSGWVDVRTQTRQKLAVAEFIAGVADGWTLSEAFLDDVRLRAVRGR